MAPLSQHNEPTGLGEAGKQQRDSEEKARGGRSRLGVGRESEGWRRTGALLFSENYHSGLLGLRPSPKG